MNLLRLQIGRVDLPTVADTRVALFPVHPNVDTSPGDVVVVIGSVHVAADPAQLVPVLSPKRVLQQSTVSLIVVHSKHFTSVHNVLQKHTLSLTAIHIEGILP